MSGLSANGGTPCLFAISNIDLVDPLRGLTRLHSYFTTVQQYNSTCFPLRGILCSLSSESIRPLKLEPTGTSTFELQPIIKIQSSGRFYDSSQCTTLPLSRLRPPSPTDRLSPHCPHIAVLSAREVYSAPLFTYTTSRWHVIVRCRLEPQRKHSLHGSHGSPKRKWR